MLVQVDDELTLAKRGGGGGGGNRGRVRATKSQSNSPLTLINASPSCGCGVVTVVSFTQLKFLSQMPDDRTACIEVGGSTMTLAVAEAEAEAERISGRRAVLMMRMMTLR